MVWKVASKDACSFSSSQLTWAACVALCHKCFLAARIHMRPMTGLKWEREVNTESRSNNKKYTSVKTLIRVWWWLGKPLTRKQKCFSIGTFPGFRLNWKFYKACVDACMCIQAYLYICTMQYIQLTCFRKDWQRLDIAYDPTFLFIGTLKHKSNKNPWSWFL